MFRTLVAVACLLALSLRARTPIVIAFLICTGLSILIIAAAIHGALIGQPISAQAYVALAGALIGCVMWGSMVRDREKVEKTDEPFQQSARDSAKDINREAA